MMNGAIKSFVPEKKFGFINGDDGKDYFFHINEFKNSAHHKMIADGAVVEFEPSATPKGYRAVNCKLPEQTDLSGVLNYVVPDSFQTSKSDIIHGWEIVEHGEWIISGTSRDSPDAAKFDAIGKARQVGANALIYLNYFKSTGSEAGTGSGTHHFTIHHFSGRIATVAKRNANGTLKLDDLLGLNNKIAVEKKRLDNAAELNKKNSLIAASVLGLISFIYCLMYDKRSDTDAMIIAAVSVVMVIGIWMHNFDTRQWLKRG